MCFESITVNVQRRNKLLDYLITQVPSIKDENDFIALRNYTSEVGLPTSDEGKSIGKYFDKVSIQRNIPDKSRHSTAKRIN